MPDITEEEYFLQSLESNFHFVKEKRIVIYGISGRTASFLKECPDHNVVGLVDSDNARAGQYYHGIKIVTMEEAAVMGVEVIIILAREQSTQIIFSQICRKCKENNIIVLNRFGKNMQKLFGNFFCVEENSREQDRITLKETLQKCSAYKIVYIAVWDVILMSYCISREDFLKLSSDRKKNSIVLRHDSIELIKQLLRLGKKVRLIQNAPLQDDIVTQILNQYMNDVTEIVHEQNIMPCDDEILISSDSRFSCHFKEWIRLPGACERLVSSVYREIMELPLNYNERLLVGLFNEKLFNSPFDAGDYENHISQIKDVGYLFVGPIIAAFMVWLIKIVKHNDYDAVLFAARDGFLIKQLYDHILFSLKITAGAKSIYFLTSRKLCINAGMENGTELVGTARHPYAYPLEFMLQNKYNVDPRDINVYKEEKYTDKEAYVLAHKKHIFSAARNLRKHYLNYMSEIGIKEGRKYLLFDMCSCGTSQHFLNNFVPFQLDAAYLCMYRSAEGFRRDWPEQLSYYTFFHNGYSFDYNSNFFRDYCFFETFLTSFTPTIIGLNDQQQFIYSREMRSEEEMRYVREMQEGITDFVENFVKLCDMEEEIDNTVPDTLFRFMKKPYSNITNPIFDNLVLWDEWGKCFVSLKKE